MYIKKMYSLVSSEPPYFEVPDLLYTQDSINLTAIAESNGSKQELDAIITECKPITGILGKYSIFGFVTEAGSGEMSHLIGIIDTRQLRTSALFLAVQ